MNPSLSRAVAAAFTSTALLLPAFAMAQTTGTTGAAGSTSTAPAASGAASTTAGKGADRGGDKNTLHRADRRFVEEAAESDLAEIATSRVAQQKAASDAVKKYAQHMIDDHTKTSERLRTLAQGKGAQLPAEPDGAEKRLIAKMEKEDAGAEFDREYIAGQVKAHQKSVRLYERQAKDGRDPELKAFASETLPNLREHLKMAQDLRGGADRKGGGAAGRGDRSAAGQGAGAGTGAGAGAGAMGGMSGSTGAAGSTGGAGSPASGAGSAGGASTTGR